MISGVFKCTDREMWCFDSCYLLVSDRRRHKYVLTWRQGCGERFVRERGERLEVDTRKRCKWRWALLSVTVTTSAAVPMAAPMAVPVHLGV